MYTFVVLLFFPVPSQGIGSGKCHRNDVYCVEWDVKPQLCVSQLTAASDVNFLCVESSATLSNGLCHYDGG